MKRSQPWQDLGVLSKGNGKSKGSEMRKSLQTRKGRRAVCLEHSKHKGEQEEVGLEKSEADCFYKC